MTERIEYKLLSLTYQVLTTTQPSYLHNLITVQPPRSTRSSSLVTLARPSTSSSLRIADLSSQYASPCLWNQFMASIRQPRTNLSNSASPSCLSGTSSISSIDSPLSSFITPSLFHSSFKTFLFRKSFQLSRRELERFWKYSNFRLRLSLLLLLGPRVARCGEAASVKTARHVFYVDLVLRGCRC